MFLRRFTFFGNYNKSLLLLQTCGYKSPPIGILSQRFASIAASFLWDQKICDWRSVIRDLNTVNTYSPELPEIRHYQCVI